MHQDLVKMKAKIDEQLSKISYSLTGFKVKSIIYDLIQMNNLRVYVFFFFFPRRKFSNFSKELENSCNCLCGYVGSLELIISISHNTL